jgi:2-hydroxy-3-keto-5-methylthiopentenyl-1-phosphate phosphatase
MFKGVNEKLERAGYFLNNLKTLVDDAGGFSYIKRHKQQEMAANLDGFFFEIVSAKDFFLQGINDRYGAGLPKTEATDISKLKQRLTDKNALRASTKIERLLATKNSWLWKLNNYRNSATHRELLHYWNKAEGPTFVVKEGEEPQFQIILDPETIGRTWVRRIDIQSENQEFRETKTYLFADPEDPSKGRADIEVIPYIVSNR